jgi:hypothetical protein
VASLELLDALSTGANTVTSVANALGISHAETAQQLRAATASGLVAWEDDDRQFTDVAADRRYALNPGTRATTPTPRTAAGSLTRRFDPAALRSTSADALAPCGISGTKQLRAGVNCLAGSREVRRERRSRRRGQGRDGSRSSSR